MAVVGPNYKFISAEVGMNGRVSDGGVWSSSEFNRQINSRENELNLPANLVFLGDGAFPLKPHLMKPYSGTQLSHDERLFNYRLSRTRRIVENVFAQIVNEFKILNNKIQLDLQSCKQVSLCCCILHNYLKTVYDCDEEEPEETMEELNLLSLEQSNAIGIDRDGERIRRQFINFFKGQGSLPFQDQML